MRPTPGATIAGLVFVLLLAGSAFGRPMNSVADRVKDGPAASIIRESLELLEKAEESEDDTASLELYQKGKVLAERALTIDESDPDAHFALFANWGRILQAEGYVRNAHHLPTLWKELDRALELDPDHAPALGAKGGLYLRLPWILGGDIAKAEPLLERAIRADPEIIGARLELAECHRQTDRERSARDLARRALQIARRDGKQRFVERAESLLEDIDSSASAPKLEKAAFSKREGLETADR